MSFSLILGRSLPASYSACNRVTQTAARSARCDWNPVRRCLGQAARLRPETEAGVAPCSALRKQQPAVSTPWRSVSEQRMIQGSKQQRSTS